MDKEEDDYGAVIVPNLFTEGVNQSNRLEENTVAGSPSFGM